MTTFDDREKGFETQYAYDKELLFKAASRRNKVLGLWVAGLLGKSGEEAEAYAVSVVMEDFTEPGDDDVLKKILADLGGAGIAMKREELRAKMDKMMLEAIEEIKR